MGDEHECPDYGTDYDAEDGECQECALASECEAAMKAEKAKPDLPSPKKRKVGKGQAMSQCFW